MKRVTPHAILVAGWIVFLLSAYPGYMTTSSVDQLVDSRVGEFTDWSSPLMTELWRRVGDVMSGPAGMMLLASALLLAGCYALARRAMSDRAAAIVAACVLVFPPVASTMALICPESMMAAFLVAGAAAILAERRAIRIVGLALLLLACGMRDGGALAALPIVVFGFVWHPTAARWRRYAIAIGAWAAIAGAACGLTAVLTDAATRRTEVTRAALDLAGILRFAAPISDRELHDTLAGVPLADDHDVQQHAIALYHRPDGPRLFDDATTDATRDAIVAARNTLARAHLGAYLAHRWHQLTRTLGLATTAHWDPVYTGFLGDRAQVTAVDHLARHSAVQRALVAVSTWLATTALFRPYVYLVVALIVLPLAAIRRQRDACILLASAIVYELSLFVTTTDIAYRNSHWMVTATLIATALMIARGWPRPRAAAATA